MCDHLIGISYEYGSAGSTVDCISLVITALDWLGLPNPGVKVAWYEMSPKAIARELATYTDRISEPTYDGDIVLLSGKPIAFGVAWQGGILYINRDLMKVDWKPTSSHTILRSYRTKSS